MGKSAVYCMGLGLGVVWMFSDYFIKILFVLLVVALETLALYGILYGIGCLFAMAFKKWKWLHDLGEKLCLLP